MISSHAEIGAGVEVAAVVDPHPRVDEPLVQQLIQHRALPSGQVIQRPAQVFLVPRFHLRKEIVAIVLVTTDIGTCGIGRRASGSHMQSVKCAKA
jgi:hypothetical protein